MFGHEDTLKTLIIFVGTFISALCSHFVYTKLKLNPIIQWQLLGMAIHHLVAFGIQLIVMINKWIFGSLTKSLCTLSMIWGTSLFSGCQVFSSAISLSRFYITWSTKKMKYPKKWIMITSTVLGFTLDLVLLTLVYTLQAYFEMPGMIASCSGFEPKETSHFKIGWITLIWMISVAVLGVVGDFGLKRYLKAKQNEGGDVQLVPWKSGGNPEQYSATIPVRATLITFLTSAFFCVFVLILIAEGFREGILILWETYGCVQLPLIIGLTVKLNQNKVAPQQPKQQLNFHDESNG